MKSKFQQDRKSCLRKVPILFFMGKNKSRKNKGSKRAKQQGQKQTIVKEGNGSRFESLEYLFLVFLLKSLLIYFCCSFSTSWRSHFFPIAELKEDQLEGQQDQSNCWPRLQRLFSHGLPAIAVSPYLIQ